MKPILFADTETAFDSNGIGILTDVTSCPVKQQLNGTYELTLKYPLTGIHAQSIKDRCIILAKPDPVSDPQPFRIYRILPSSKGTITVYARHLVHDTMGIPVEPFSASSAAEAMVQAKSHAVIDCPWTLSTDKSTKATMAPLIPKSLWKTLGGSEGSILDTYGGEYEFDRYHIKLHARRGADRGVSIRYGKNLTTLEQDRNCANVYTGVYPYWASPEGVLVQLPERYINAEGEYSFSKILTLDLSAEFMEQPTEDQLRKRAKRYMSENDIGKPDVGWKIEFVALEQTDEYKGKAILEQVLLGDTVNAYFPLMDVDVSSRAVEVEFDSILERYNYIYLGKVKANIADTIVKQQQEIERKPSVTVMQTIASAIAVAINGAKGGCIRQLDTDGDGMPDEFYIADNPDPALAKKVWRFNYMGLAASPNGYNGPFVMGATFEDGILAHMVTAANLVAGTIQSADGGKTVFIDLDNGIVKLKAVQDLNNDIESLSSDLDGYKKEVSTQFDVLANGVEISVSEKLKSEMAASDSDLQDQINEITTNYRFTADGQYIGRTNDEAILRLAAGVIDVLVAGQTSATFDRMGLNALQAIIRSLLMGEFVLSVSDDGDILSLQ